MFSQAMAVRISIYRNMVWALFFFGFVMSEDDGHRYVLSEPAHILWQKLRVDHIHTRLPQPSN